MKRNIHCSCNHDAVTLNYLPILVLVKVGSGIARGGVWAVQTPPIEKCEFFIAYN